MNQQEPTRHNFLEYDSKKPLIQKASGIAAYILNLYTGNKLSVTKYRNIGKLSMSHKTTLEKCQVRFDDILKHIIETRSFNAETFNFPPIHCGWLDLLEIEHDAPRMKDESGTVRFQLQMPFQNFPLVPTLDCEGMIFGSFQSPIQRNILRLHRVLIEESHSFTGVRKLEWVNDMRMLLNDCISLVDVTLHQLYFAAQYGLKMHWRFDQEKLGQRHGVRISEKFRWVGLITGRPLDNARDEVDSFNVLRGIRNHLNHFDPPCVVISIDDAADWLNRVPRIGDLIWKIREKLEAQLTQELVEIMLLPIVKVNPKFSNNPRAKQAEDAGYRSSTWDTA
jgi:hypothetical protein